MISTSIKLDGEAEFKKQLSNVNGELRNLKSDMQLVTAQFDGQANSLEALTAKDELLRREIEQQEEKVRALTQAYSDSMDVYGEVDSRTDKYRQSLNRAKTELLEMQRELQDTDRYMDEARRSTDKTADSIDEFGQVVKSADGPSDKDGLKGLIGSLGNLKAFMVGGAVVGGIKEVADAIFEITDATKEYRQIMGTLELSSQKAGYTTEETAEAYERLYGVLGDTQTTATTVANLQAIGLEQEDLMELIDATTGAWATYGDSIPIDQLSESINLASQQSEVTSALADAIEWAGGDVEEFAARLEEANTAEERGQIILEELKRNGLDVAGQGWRDLNEDIVSANESQMEWDQALGELGEFLQPAADALRSFGADAIEWVTGLLKDAVEWIDKVVDAMGRLNDKRNNLEQSRMEAYGFETYVDENNQTRYRKVEDGLVSTDISEPRAATAQDVYDATLAASGYASAGERRRSGDHFTATVTLTTEDGRNLGQYVTPFVNEENAANPPVRSDDV